MQPGDIVKLRQPANHDEAWYRWIVRDSGSDTLTLDPVQGGGYERLFVKRDEAAALYEVDPDYTDHLDELDTESWGPFGD